MVNLGKDPCTQSQRPKAPWECCSLTEKSRLCGQTALGLNLGLGNSGLSCLDKFFPLPEPQFPVSSNKGNDV